MSTFEQSFRAAENTALRFLQVDFGFVLKERHITDDGTSGTGGVVRYASTGRSSNGPPHGWSVTLSFYPLRLELDLDIATASGPSYSVAELHQRERGRPLPPREHNLSEAARDTDAQRAEFERLALALRASGERFFKGDVTLWSDLEAQRRGTAQREEDRSLLSASERAFRAKDWTHVVTLLERASGRLGPAGAARLAYARKKVQRA